MSEGEDAAPTKKGSLYHFDEDSGCASGDESDDSGKGALLDDETAASAALQARVARDSYPPRIGSAVSLLRINLMLYGRQLYNR